MWPRLALSSQSSCLSLPVLELHACITTPGAVCTFLNLLTFSLTFHPLALRAQQIVSLRGYNVSFKIQSELIFISPSPDSP